MTALKELSVGAELASRTFRALPEEIRKELLTASSQDPAVIGYALQEGYWATLVSRLGDMALSSGEERYAELGEVIQDACAHLPLLRRVRPA